MKRLRKVRLSKGRLSKVRLRKGWLSKVSLSKGRFSKVRGQVKGQVYAQQIQTRKRHAKFWTHFGQCRQHRLFRCKEKKKTRITKADPETVESAASFAELRPAGMKICHTRAKPAADIQPFPGPLL